VKESPLGNVRQFAHLVDGDISHALGRSEFEGGIQEGFFNEARVLLFHVCVFYFSRLHLRKSPQRSVRRVNLSRFIASSTTVSSTRPVKRSGAKYPRAFAWRLQRHQYIWQDRRTDR